MAKKPNVPAISQKVDASVRRAVEALQSFLADLAGKVELQAPAIKRVADGISGALAPYLMPVAPTGLVVTGAFNKIILQWDEVSQSGFSYMEVWRASVDDISLAVLVGSTPGATLADTPQDTSLAKTYYYWIRAVNGNNPPNYGPFNATAGTSGSTADDPAYVLEVLAGELKEAQLFTGLSSRIDLIDAPTTGLVDQVLAQGQQITDLAGSIAGSVYVQISAPVAGVGGVPDPISDNARWYDSDDNNHPYIWQGGIWNDLLDPRIGANSADIDALEVTVNDPAIGVNANASAIGVLDTTVTSQGTSITANAAAITTLDSSLTTTDGNVSANAGAVSGLDTRVTTAEGDITSTASSLATLDVQVNDATTGLPAAHSAISTEQTARADGDTTVAATVTALSSQVNNATTGLPAAHSAIQTEQTTRASADNTMASDITTLQTTVGGNTASLSTKAEVSALNAVYEIKTDVNGRVAGFGLVNDTTNGSEFGILADRFWIADPANPNTPQEFPLIVSGGKVYLNVALIQAATITNLMVKDVAADKLTAGIITAAIEIIAPLLKSSATSPQVEFDLANKFLKMINAGGDYVQITPGGFVYNVAGVNMFEFNAGVVSLRDADGAVILQSGGNLDYTRVGGIKPPADANNTTNTNQLTDGANLGGTADWTNVSNKSGLAALTQITNANRSAALALKVIGGAFVDDAAVNTLQIGLNAVTVPVSVTKTTASNSSQGTLDAEGQPVFIHFFGSVPATSTGYTITLYRDGVAIFLAGSVSSIWVTDASEAGGYFVGGSLTFSFSETTPTGLHTYEVRLASGKTFTRSTLLLLGVKR